MLVKNTIIVCIIYQPYMCVSIIVEKKQNQDQLSKENCKIKCICKSDLLKYKIVCATELAKYIF